MNQTKRFEPWKGWAKMLTVSAIMLTTTMLLVSCDAGDRDPSKMTSSRGTTLSLLPEGATHNEWVVRYNGYGSVYGASNEILLEPQSAASADITHGGLVHTSQQYTDAEFAVTLETQKQIRQGSPNPWEVGWVLWNYQDDSHFYAVALKPNGWEVTKQDPDFPGEQRFLATGTSPKFAINKQYRVAVNHTGDTFTVTVDGEELATVTDTQTPYVGGSIGLYTEDTRVLFSDFQLPDPDSATNTFED